MEAPANRLRINVSNIKNSLVGYNREMRKLRLQEKRIVFDSQKREQMKEKENKLESSGVGKTIESVKSRILSGPLGFFDKVKEFLGIVLLGLFVNNLPSLIAGLKKFFSENSWLIEAVKLTIKVVGVGIQSLIWLVSEYPKQKQLVMEKQLDGVKKQVDQILSIGENALSLWTAFFNPRSFGGGTPPSSPTMMASPGSMYPTSFPSSTPSSSSVAPASQENSERQRFSKGGTVKAKGQETSKTTETTGFRGVSSTPLGRKAIESVDSFENFETVASQSKINADLLADRDGVNDTFTKVNESFQTFLEFFKRSDKAHTPLDPNLPPGGGRNNPLEDLITPGVTIPSKFVLGTVGYTGRVRPAGAAGSHIHIENHDSPGASIPSSVKNSILINGVPMPTALKFTSGIGNRSGGFHAGEDYAGPHGQGISLTGGLQYIKYVPMGTDPSFAGYGNVLVIRGADKKKYFLAHLNSGPTPEALDEIKRKKKDPVAELAGSALKALERDPATTTINIDDLKNIPVRTLPRGLKGNGGSDLRSSAETETTYLVTQTFIQQIPIMMPPQVIKKEVRGSSPRSYSKNSAFSSLG